MDYPGALFRKDRTDMNVLSGFHAGNISLMLHRVCNCIILIRP
jgi:hypothetical protein